MANVVSALLSRELLGKRIDENMENDINLSHFQYQIQNSTDRHKKIFLFHCRQTSLVNAKKQVISVNKFSDWCVEELRNAKAVSLELFFRYWGGGDRAEYIKSAEYIIIDAQTPFDLSRVGKAKLCSIIYGEMYTIKGEQVEPKKIVFVSKYDHTEELQYLEPSFRDRVVDFLKH